MKRLFAYLLQTRFLSKDVVKSFVEQKILYQEKEHGNVVLWEQKKTEYQSQPAKNPQRSRQKASE